jgi:biopolymer transport protein TolR
MNAAQVRARARMAMKRREEQLQVEEMEGGEINLIPYLDIITNVVMFLLISVTGGLVLGSINSSLPEYSEASATDPSQNPTDEPPVQLVVAIGKSELQLFSLSGLEGTLAQPKIRIPAKRAAQDYDFAKLNDAAAEIVKRRWGAKPMLRELEGKPVCQVGGAPKPLTDCRPAKATEVYLMVDGDIPYSVVVAAMDALRETKEGTILFPGIIFSSGISTVVQ